MEAFFICETYFKNTFFVRRVLRLRQLANIYELNRTRVKWRCIDGHHLMDYTPMSGNGDRSFKANYKQCNIQGTRILFSQAHV